VSEPKPVRLFVAADVPETHLAWLERKTIPLRDHYRGGRWAPIANQHVTLKFLGSTPLDRLDDVAKVCATVAQTNEASAVALAGLGSFPSTRRMRVLWAGLIDERELLKKLAADMEQAFEPLGYKAEARDFTPHLTLARFRSPVRLSEPLPDVGLKELPAWPVDRIRLYRSHLSPKGARYEVLEELELR
jgi:RNA 2',3'-cyclic 3'-phosphodiesterase